jgi:hypothetical protein
MPSPRYTVRLPSALDAAVQEHIRTSGTPFATLIRDALSAYLADILPTVTPTTADSADTLREVQAHLAALTARVEILELALTAVPTPRRQPDDRDATISPTAADTPASPRRPGRPSGSPPPADSGPAPGPSRGLTGGRASRLSPDTAPHRRYAPGHAERWRDYRLGAGATSAVWAGSIAAEGGEAREGASAILAFSLSPR